MEDYDRPPSRFLLYSPDFTIDRNWGLYAHVHAVGVLSMVVSFPDQQVGRRSDLETASSKWRLNFRF